MLLHEIHTESQINLDLTEWEIHNEDNLVVQHDCLHVTVWTENKNDPQEIISYCMSEWPSQWNIEKSLLDKHLTFADLYKQNIATQQLFLWSTPLDIIENYQLYLNGLSSMSTKLFYNCTLPSFGSMCQYTFDDYNSNYTSLTEFIRDFYRTKIYKPTTLTCYTHLQCNRGANSTCLDWTEICNGKIDCLNDAIDEEQCWQFEIHECKDDEFRCYIGQCIPEIFVHDNPNFPDCLDASDEIYPSVIPDQQCDAFAPSIGCEDIVCSINQWETLLRPLTSSCLKERTELLLKALFSDKPNGLLDECWSAFNCILHMPDVDNPACRDLCQNGACTKMIREYCPDMLYVPAFPVLFGHIYYAYTKNDSKYSARTTQAPQYLCYNDQLCGGLLSNKTLVTFNNSTCRAMKDFPLKYELVRDISWLRVWVAPYFKQLYKCNTIIRKDSTFCNKSTMYQCINSSKCISKYRIYDSITDCDYNDDEDVTLLDSVYPIEEFKKLFKCTTNNTYISHNRVGDGVCDCGYDKDNLCADEWPERRYIKKHISFPTICDGYMELLPIVIDERNETDETGCEYWSCNNTYTRCDGFWNCLNGADEIDCNSSPLLNCSPHSHICISIKTMQLMCLPIEKANNGEIDCLGATDEPELCRGIDHRGNKESFYCGNYKNKSTCITSEAVCDHNRLCPLGDYQQSCSNIWSFSLSYVDNCKRELISNLTDIHKYFCTLLDELHKPRRVHFFLDRSSNPEEDITSHSSIIKPISQHQHHCHRGLPLRVWLNREKNSSITTCLCPPSFYGDMCQYQNQRVALTIKFRPFAISRRIPFTIVVTLIDDDDQRIIHSHQQLTYLPMQHCQTKFNIYLLFSTRPKNETKDYFVHIDFFEKISLQYHGSILLPVNFNFLPVSRIATQLNIPYISDSINSCSDQHCIHGKCMKYFNDPKNSSFCQCNRGWSGRYCTIPHNCSCSSDSLCNGRLANSRSLCVCPVDKVGSKCLIRNPICQPTSCYNDGQCIPLDTYAIFNKTFECICRNDYFGDRCEIPNNKLILSFDKKIILPPSILVHFIQVMHKAAPEIGATFKTTPIYQNSISVFWSRPFHIAFVELFVHQYYLIAVQKTFNQSMTTVKTLTLSDRCPNINEILNETFAQFHLIRRIKYYHLLCASELSCFYDEVHFCLCNDYGNQRHANCFEFNHTLQRDCSGRSNCQNDAQCLQDSVNCPKTSVCNCPSCIHGALCQFNSERFGLSLDAILGYHIGPNISMKKQLPIIQISATLTVIMILASILNSTLSLITFNNKVPKKTGCGVYLICSSVASLITMVIFSLKFWILVLTQMKMIENRSFLYFQCKSFDFLLRVGLNMDQWLNACIAMDRLITVMKGINFNQKQNKEMAKYIILFVLLMIISTSIQDPLHRRLLDDDKRIWCIITYSHSFQLYNSIINLFHFFVPFIINIISAIVIIIATSRQRKTSHATQSDRKLLHEQFKQHKHLLFSPMVLVILAIPRLIISFASGCMQSSQDSWAFLAGYFVSFIPPILTFVIFVLPSKTYKDEFKKCINQYRQRLRARFYHAS